MVGDMQTTSFSGRFYRRMVAVSPLVTLPVQLIKLLAISLLLKRNSHQHLPASSDQAGDGWL